MKRIPESRVTAILERAAELDQATISLEALRSAAIDAGISPAAFEQAISEFESAPEPSTKPAFLDPQTIWSRFKANGKRLLHYMKFAGFAFLLGSVTSDMEALIPLTFLGGIYLAWRVARAAKREGKARGFQALMIAITFGLTFGTAAFADEDLAMSFFILGLLLFAVGTAYIESWWRRLVDGVPS